MGGQDIRPDTFVLVATRLLEAGGLANYVRSAQVSEVVLNESRWAPALIAEPATPRGSTNESPLPWRFLFVAWLTLGMAGTGISWWLRYDHWQAILEVWGGGCLVLVCASVWRHVLSLTDRTHS